MPIPLVPCIVSHTEQTSVCLTSSRYTCNCVGVVHLCAGRRISGTFWEATTRPCYVEVESIRQGGSDWIRVGWTVLSSGQTRQFVLHPCFISSYRRTAAVPRCWPVVFTRYRPATKVEMDENRSSVRTGGKTARQTGECSAKAHSGCAHAREQWHNVPTHVWTRSLARLHNW